LNQSPISFALGLNFGPVAVLLFDADRDYHIEQAVETCLFPSRELQASVFRALSRTNLHLNAQSALKHVIVERPELTDSIALGLAHRVVEIGSALVHDATQASTTVASDSASGGSLLSSSGNYRSDSPQPSLDTTKLEASTYFAFISEDEQDALATTLAITAPSPAAPPVTPQSPATAEVAEAPEPPERVALCNGIEHLANLHEFMSEQTRAQTTEILNTLWQQLSDMFMALRGHQPDDASSGCASLRTVSSSSSLFSSSADTPSSTSSALPTNLHTTGAMILSVEAVNILAVLLQAFYIHCSTSMMEHRFLEFTKRFERVLRRMVRLCPQILFSKLDFILANYHRCVVLCCCCFCWCAHSLTLVHISPEWQFRDLVQVLTFDQKRRWLHHKIAEIRGQFQGRSFNLTVPRTDFMQHSCSSLLGNNITALMGDLTVHFEGEPGSGAGVRREWFQLIVREMFNPDNALFTPCAEGTFQPNPSSHANPDHLSFFRFVGVVIGLAIYHQELLDVYFTRSFYKHMLGVPIEFADMESVDPEYHRNLKSILTVDDVEDLELVFTAEHYVFGVSETIELVPNGKAIPVTNDNRVRQVTAVMTDTQLLVQAFVCVADSKSLCSCRSNTWIW